MDFGKGSINFMGCNTIEIKLFFFIWQFQDVFEKDTRVLLPLSLQETLINNTWSMLLNIYIFMWRSMYPMTKITTAIILGTIGMETKPDLHIGKSPHSKSDNLENWLKVLCWVGWVKKDEYSSIFCPNLIYKKISRWTTQILGIRLSEYIFNLG